jgi:hypothetical protein
MKCFDLDENFRKYAIKRFKNESVVRLSKKNSVARENSPNFDIFTKKRYFHRFFTKDFKTIQNYFFCFYGHLLAKFQDSIFNFDFFSKFLKN